MVVFLYIFNLKYILQNLCTLSSVLCYNADKPFHCILALLRPTVDQQVLKYKTSQYMILRLQLFKQKLQKKSSTKGNWYIISRQAEINVYILCVLH